jgi:hypothetical protein
VLVVIGSLQDRDDRFRRQGRSALDQADNSPGVPGRAAKFSAVQARPGDEGSSDHGV